jgi:hypothetical protein
MIKRANIKIYKIEEGAKRQTKDIENPFIVIIPENSQNLVKGIEIQGQENLEHQVDLNNKGSPHVTF